MTRCIRLPAPRGLITDRKGRPLVVDAPQDLVVAVPALLGRSPDAVGRLAALLDRPAGPLQQALAGADQLEVPLALVPADVGSRVDAAGITGVLVTPHPRRAYLYGAMLGPLLGYTGVATPADTRRWPGLPAGEVVGRAGIEEQYDPILRGIDGVQCFYVDPAGRPVALGASRTSVPGRDLRLSIDLGLEQELTSNLITALNGEPGGHRGDLAGAVAMDPTTGQVLAMASAPSYDDTMYGPPVDTTAVRNLAGDPGDPALEHATQVIAPPGSAFKLVIAAADVINPVFPPDEVVPTGASFTLGDHTFKNWTALGPQDLTDAIAWSNDVYFYKLALALGPGRIHQVGSLLGVGRPTGIDLPGESSGFLGTPESVARAGGAWYAGSTVILGIGQGAVTVTPLQAACWAGAIATGESVVPRLGLAVVSGPGPAAPLPRPAAVPLPFAAALGPVQEGMRGAVADGTATVLNDLPVAAGAKTGTAQDPAAPNGASDSWMVAVAPIDHPAVVIASFVRGGGFGAVTSGPVVNSTLQWFFAHERAVLAAAS